MANEPMTDDQLDEIDEMLHNSESLALAVQVMLADEVERLRAECDRLKTQLDTCEYQRDVLRVEAGQAYAAVERERAANRQLVTECAALDTQVKAMRPIVATVAEVTGTAFNGHCDACGGERVMAYDAKRFVSRLSADYQHTPECVFTQARAYVAAHPAAEREGE